MLVVPGIYQSVPRWNNSVNTSADVLGSLRVRQIKNVNDFSKAFNFFISDSFRFSNVALLNTYMHTHAHAHPDPHKMVYWTTAHTAFNLLTWHRIPWCLSKRSLLLRCAVGWFTCPSMGLYKLGLKVVWRPHCLSIG